METLRLLRLPAITATPGILLTEVGLLALTLELPWKDNQRNISCIPLGNYRCVMVKNRTTNGGMGIKTTFEVIAVPDRDGILFHIGNTVKDTEGCILLGKGFNLDRKITLSASKVAFIEFIAYFEKEKEFMLRIDKYE